MRPSMKPEDVKARRERIVAQLTDEWQATSTIANAANASTNMVVAALRDAVLAGKAEQQTYTHPSNYGRLAFRWRLNRRMEG